MRLRVCSIGVEEGSHGMGKRLVVYITGEDSVIRRGKIVVLTPVSV